MGHAIFGPPGIPWRENQQQRRRRRVKFVKFVKFVKVQNGNVQAGSLKVSRPDLADLAASRFAKSLIVLLKYLIFGGKSCRSRCLRGKDAAPLLELLPRQAEASRSKGGKAEAKRREKASTRAPVPFEPQESRPKAESDALRAPEPERLVPSVEAEEAPCEAAEPEGKAGEPHDDAKNVADAEAVDRGNEAQLAEDEGDKAELAIPAPSLNAGALEFLPEPAEEMLVMEVVPRPDLPLDETFETQGFDGGLMGFDYGPSMEASTFDAGGGGYLEPMDGDPMAYQSYGGSYDGGYNASYEMGQMGYSAETHSYGSYDGYESNYPAQEYDSYGYMQEHGWSEPGWNDSAPFAGDEMPLQEVSQPSQRTWVFSQEDKESSAAPLAELPDPGLGRASLARRNEKGQGQQGQRHGGWQRKRGVTEVEDSEQRLGHPRSLGTPFAVAEPHRWFAGRIRAMGLCGPPGQDPEWLQQQQDARVVRGRLLQGAFGGGAAESGWAGATAARLSTFAPGVPIGGQVLSLTGNKHVRATPLKSRDLINWGWLEYSPPVKWKGVVECQHACVVRSGASLDSEWLDELPPQTVVLVVEEQEASGRLRLRLSEPLDGWVTAKYVRRSVNGDAPHGHVEEDWKPLGEATFFPDGSVPVTDKTPMGYPVDIFRGQDVDLSFGSPAAMYRDKVEVAMWIARRVSNFKDSLGEEVNATLLSDAEKPPDLASRRDQRSHRPQVLYIAGVEGTGHHGVMPMILYPAVRQYGSCTLSWWRSLREVLMKVHPRQRRQRLKALLEAFLVVSASALRE
ncbi:unnamed protein product [Cladocopium goreaui]|uniref:Aurora kinase A n=1 Tax=Cladocopium goreaui TaxID=2562237 RepID=A0A9P1DU65_9DINO|nr:unnamed protein product [Cladocopium goreaui]